MPNLPDLPNEVLYHILHLFVTSRVQAPLFWTRGISYRTLLPPNVDNDMYKELGREQFEITKRLCLVSKRLRNVFVRLIWSRFQCSSAKGLSNLRNACVSHGELGSYVQHLDLRLCFKDTALPPNLISSQLEAIWPHLTSICSLTLVLTSAYACPDWLVAQLQQVPTLHTLRLSVFGNSLGSHLRSLPQIQNICLEIHPPDLDGNLTEWISSDESMQTQRAFYHDWTMLFNNVAEFIEANATRGNLQTMNLFIYWSMVHSFYKHLGERTAEPNVKFIDPSALQGLSRLSLTLESQMGSQPFLDAARRLPLTDLAFTSYDLNLLNGTVFRAFCNAFPGLRRLRIKLRSPSHTVGGGSFSVPEGVMNEEEFVKGLASLRNLEAYKGPVLFQRQASVEARRSLRSQVDGSLTRLVRLLRASRVNSGALFQWHVWTDGVYGPKEYMVLPGDGPEVLGVDVC